MIDVNKFQQDKEPRYCPLCEELVILRDGQRSCRCTRVKRSAADHEVVLGWVLLKDIECNARGCHHRDIGVEYSCEKGDIRCAYRNRES